MPFLCTLSEFFYWWKIYIYFPSHCHPSSGSIYLPLEQGVKSVQRHWRHPAVFIVNFEHILHLFLVSLLLVLNM